jgi:hypothetical protein
VCESECVSDLVVARDRDPRCSLPRTSHRKYLYTIVVLVSLIIIIVIAIVVVVIE